MYRVLIVEDADLDAGALRQAILRYGSEHHEEFVVTRIRTAMELPDERDVFDLIFMDIGLPGISGMEAAELLRTYDTETPLIFVTDLAQYAVKGYQVDALDFIIKPVVYFDFSLRMNRALRMARRTQGERASVSARDGIHVFRTADLVYVDVLGHNLRYHLKESDDIEARGSLAKIADELPGDDFVRISNNCLVNMGHIHAVQRDAVRVSNGDTLYFSRPRHKAALATITDYLGGSF